jgi:hypothetical protein
MKYAVTILALSFGLVASAAHARTTTYHSPAKTVANPASKFCIPGYSYFYLPPEKGGGLAMKDNCTGQITLVKGG